MKKRDTVFAASLSDFMEKKSKPAGMEFNILSGGGDAMDFLHYNSFATIKITISNRCSTNASIVSGWPK